MDDLRNYGFAPGHYTAFCSQEGCETHDTGARKGEFVGAKGAWRCEACATKVRDANRAEQAREEKPRRIPQLVRDLMAPREGFDEANVRVSPILMQTLLVAKAHSEIEEVALDVTNPEEYGDVLECLMALAELNGIGWADVEKARREKRARKGGLHTGNLWIPEAFTNKDEEADVEIERAA